MGLNNLSNRLTRLGKRAQAITALDCAIDLIRGFAGREPKRPKIPQIAATCAALARS
jgi:hypothetical protein